MNGLSVVLLLAPMTGFAAQADIDPHDVVLEVFVRADSPVCRQAVEAAETLARERGGLRIIESDVTADPSALRRYWQLVKQHAVAKPVMPAFYCCGRFHVGFGDEAACRAALEEMLTIRVFSREGCPHCRDAKAFLHEFLANRPALRLEDLDVMRDSEARRRMEQVAKSAGKRVTGLPVIQAGGELFVGYQTDDTTGRRIAAVFDPPAVTKNQTGAIQASPPHRSAFRTNATRALARTAWRMFPQAARLAVLGQVDTAVAKESFASSDDLPPPPPPDDLPPAPPEEFSPALTAPTADAVEEIELPYFGPIRLRDWGLPLFTLIIGLVDGFNPCAMWVLVFLLSVLVNVRNRARILAIAGTFVFVSGAAYFAFMAAWLNLFVLLGFMRPLQIALGCFAVGIGVLNVKDFFAFKRGLSLSIPESAKPGIYDRVRRIVSAKTLPLAVLAAVVLAVLVNTVELLCTAGLPALYSEVLTLQKLPWWQNYAYLALYIAAYMFDDTLLLSGFVITLSHRRLQEREGRMLKLISGVVILLLGLVMVLKPEWLHLMS